MMGGGEDDDVPAAAEAAEAAGESHDDEAPGAAALHGLDYDPDILTRYVHYHKTGEDLHNPPAPDGSNDARESEQPKQPQEQPPPKKKKQKRKHIPPAVLETRRTIQLCCRDNDLPLALRTFHHALRGLIKMEASVFYNLLNLCEGSFATREGAHVGTPKHAKKGGEMQNTNDATPEPAIDIPLEQRLHHAQAIHSLASRLRLPLIEPAYTALIRLACRAGDCDTAEEYLDEAEATQQCRVKLRTYSSLLRSYCGELEEKGDAAEEVTREGLVKALQVWKRLHDRSGGPSDGHPSYSTNIKEGKDSNATLFGEGIAPKIQLSECEYAALVRCATRLHDVPVMERILSDVADMVAVPGLNTTEAMVEWFRADAGHTANDGAFDKSSSALEQVTLPPREDPLLGSVTNKSGNGWRVYRGCAVDANSGALTLPNPEGAHDASLSKSEGRHRLKPVELTDRAWNAMREMNRSIVLEGSVQGHVSQYQGGGKGKKRARGSNGHANNTQSKPRSNQHNDGGKSNWRMEAWKEFETFIREHPPYNVVIDGANVGYFQQNFTQSPKHVDYKQIDWLVRHLLEQSASQRIILFLHERHFSSKLAPPWANPIIQSWDSYEPPYDRCTVYRTPAGMNDDWYWMHAALINGGKEDRPSVLAVTNDEMRDHHFQMLAEGSFLRWKERHRVTFDFGSWDGNSGRREVLLTHPKRYSRRVQRVERDDGKGGEAFVVPLPKRGDEGRFADGVHVAEEGVPEEETYVVVQRVL